MFLERRCFSCWGFSFLFRIFTDLRGFYFIQVMGGEDVHISLEPLTQKKQKKEREGIMKRSILLAIMAFAVAAFIGVTATPSMAVHKSSGNGLACGSCHTMHASEDGSGSTPTAKLLDQSGTTTASFCLQCHAESGDNASTDYDGTTPPKVFLTTSAGWDETKSYSFVGAGGDFANSGTFLANVWANTDGTDSQGVGHSIGSTTPTPPGGQADGAAVALVGTFTCTHCHDAHGTDVSTTSINNYRNLLMNITLQTDGANSAAAVADSYAGGVGSTTAGTAPLSSANIWPVYGDDAASHNTYTRQFSRFCAQCHGNWHEALVAADTNWVNPAGDWKRHPVDEEIDPAGGSNYAATVPAGTIDTTNLTAATVGFKVPGFSTAGAAVYYPDNVADGVFCLTCHFAHSGPYDNILRWNYGTVAVADSIGCQQCHNK
jgi:hypothetical protein